MDDEVTAYVDKMISEAREILKNDRILAHLKGMVPSAEPPADPDLPKPPKARPPVPEPAARHWWFGETG